jgi:hypothetical protein
MEVHSKRSREGTERAEPEKGARLPDTPSVFLNLHMCLFIFSFERLTVTHRYSICRLRPMVRTRSTTLVTEGMLVSLSLSLALVQLCLRFSFFLTATDTSL